jgi:hypothetical protein
MNHWSSSKYLFILSAIRIFSIQSCRKKDEKYEGTYVGTERHSIHDSTGTVYSLDTTYTQEFYIDYSKTKKYYSITKLFAPPRYRAINVIKLRFKHLIVNYLH